MGHQIGNAHDWVAVSASLGCLLSRTGVISDQVLPART
jgi:hypothetical protein